MRHVQRAFAAYIAFLRRLKQYLLHEPNPVVQIFYLHLIVGGYSGFLLAGLPLLPNAALGQFHIFLTFAVVAATMHSFIRVSTTPPGIQSTKLFHLYDNYDYDSILYTKQDCRTCETTKIARSKHCAICGTCVPRFDHHCVWINGCIGEQNHALFLYFLLTNVIFCGYGSFLLFSILSHEFRTLQDEHFVDDASGHLVHGDPLVIVRYLMHSEPILCILWVLSTFMGVAVVFFLGFHVYLVTHNLTTNEFFKWRAIRQEEENTFPQSSRHHYYDLGSWTRNIAEVFAPRCEPNVQELWKKYALATEQEQEQKQKKQR